MKITKEKKSVRYFYHPESDCLFTANDDSPLEDLCVEEITEEEFLKISEHYSGAES